MCQGHIRFGDLYGTDCACSGAVCVREVARVWVSLAPYGIPPRAGARRQRGSVSLVTQDLFLLGPGRGAAAVLLTQGRRAAAHLPSTGRAVLAAQGPCSSQSSPFLWGHCGVHKISSYFTAPPYGHSAALSCPSRP